MPFVENPRIVRGLDYYSHTAFEFVTDRLGAQGTVLAGGRYDGLVAEMGGPPTPAVGWAAGVERLAMLLPERAASAPRSVAVIPIGEAAEDAALERCCRRCGAPASAPRSPIAATSSAAWSARTASARAPRLSWARRRWRGAWRS